ncbi:MAG: phosphoesterase [Planctomyces sp.]|nr:phosphoesterase [Planctomyces sp.]
MQEKIPKHEKLKESVHPLWKRVKPWAEWLGGQEPIVLLAILLVVACAWGFIELADDVSDGESHAFDMMVLRAMRQPDDPLKPIGPEWAGEFGRDITALGGYPVLIFATFSVAGFLWLDAKKRTMGVLLIAITTGFLLSLGLKWIFQRPRPDVVPHLAIVDSTSFPSGHSMMSAVVFLTLGTLLAAALTRRRLRIFILANALFLTLVIGMSRVYLGVHYPTDVLAGWTAGLVWAIFCWLIARALQRKGRIVGHEGDEIPEVHEQQEKAKKA